MDTILKHLQAWWKNFTMSSEERYLSNSIDHGDLENRLRRLEYLRNQPALFPDNK